MGRSDDEARASGALDDESATSPHLHDSRGYVLRITRLRRFGIMIHGLPARARGLEAAMVLVYADSGK